MPALKKYPRTPHLKGSRGPRMDDDIPFSRLAGRDLVVEEKLDGANCAVSFSRAGDLMLQSRGHFLTGGPRERHFALLKTWASRHQMDLHEALGARYVMFGEWLYAKHTVYYDRLPHYFLEFDLLDTRSGQFLCTDRRATLLADLPVTSVPVLWRGRAKNAGELAGRIGRSLFKGPDWQDHLVAAARARGLDVARARRETDPSIAMEGLYIKVEQQGVVRERCKYVRRDFLDRVFASRSHWRARPLIPNRLRPDVDLFA